MRNILSAILASMSIIASATDYYVSSSGNDTNNGASSGTPWKTLSRVNSVFPRLKPGDRILFKRGDTFTGTLNISRSGEADSPITLGAFGTGKNPVISGFMRLNGWVNAGNGIFSNIVSVESPPCMITIGDKQYGMGRYPNNSFMIYESHHSNYSITDDQLTSYPDWTGADVVINKQNWLLNRYLITRHTGKTIEYNVKESRYNPKDDRGYFIQNDLRTLDTFGEWYFSKSESRLYMFFGNISPEKLTVRIATVNHLVYNYLKNWIILDGLSLEGSIQDAVRFDWVDNCIVRNCTVKYSGQSGMDIRGKHNKIESNDISICNMAGIYIEGANARITQNFVQDIGLIPGATTNGNISEGIFAGGNNSFIQYNRVMNVGRMGIRAGSGWITQIRNNFVNYYMLVLNDGGGIYVDGKLESTRIIEGNIVLNGHGKSAGSEPAACGIYLDEYSSNVIVRHNTIAFNTIGINLHRANGNLIENNTCFGNKSQIALHNTSFIPTIYENVIQNNIFFPLENSDLNLFFRSKTDDIHHFGKAGNNYYATIPDNDKTFYTFSPFTGKRYRTFSGWQTFSHQDANSHSSSIDISDASDIHFYYNASKIHSEIPLIKQMTDIKRKKYSKKITLEPYTSIVLIPDP